MAPLLHRTAIKSTRAQQFLRWVTVWPQYTWAEKWGAALPLSVGELGPHVTHCHTPALRPTSLPSGILIVLRVEIQPRLI